MRCLILSSCLFIFFSCTPAYKNLQPATGNLNNLQKFKPAFTTVLYTANVDVVGKHLSGLLLIKKMPDSSIRMVFSNEMGFKFFDFEFNADGIFKVYSIIKQLNKKPAIKTLSKDFELMLMHKLDTGNAYLQKDNELLYYVFPQSKGLNYYITNSEGDKLIRLERASKRKPVTQIIMKNYIDNVPDTIFISHTKFSFTIGLKRIENNVTK